MDLFLSVGSEPVLIKWQFSLVQIKNHNIRYLNTRYRYYLPITLVTSNFIVELLPAVDWANLSLAFNARTRSFLSFSSS